MPSFVEIAREAVNRSGKDINVPDKLSFERCQQIINECGFDLLFRFDAANFDQAVEAREDQQ